VLPVSAQEIRDRAGWLTTARTLRGLLVAVSAKRKADTCQSLFRLA
jgi:hypothetical protein